MRTSPGLIGEAADYDRAIRPGRKPNPQSTAWMVLSIAFTVFVLLVAGAVVGGKHYYETASVTARATLTIEDGIVLFRDSVTSLLINASNNLELREGDEVLVGQGARASLRLFDGSVIQLYSGSELALTELRKSRFHDGFEHLSVMLKKGTARILAQEPTSPERTFSVATPYGAARVTAGSHGVQVTESQARISSRSGSATVLAHGQLVELGGGQKAVLSEDVVSGALPEGDPLVKNGTFKEGFSQWNPIDINEPGRPEEPGSRSLETEKIDGKETIVLRVSRQSPRAIHNETGLSQAINADVLDYNTLKLRAKVKVTGQSLSGGGYMGYEYPIMIRVRYRDSTGGQIDWTHGFFVTNPEGRPTPNGEEVPRGEWVSYDGDLMEVSPKPEYVIAVEVLGAGHTFEGAIADVELIGK